MKRRVGPRAPIFRMNLWLPVALVLSLTGCGAVQLAKETVVNTTRAIFIAQTTRLKLDLVAREAINNDEKDQPRSVVIRVYQLKDAKAFDSLAYDKVLNEDAAIPRDTRLATKELVLRPGATVSLDEPLDKAAQAVVVTAFFRREAGKGSWALVIPREQLSDDRPVRVSVTGSNLQRDEQDKG